MDIPTIETAEQAEAALAELDRMAAAILDTPGGHGLMERKLSGLTTEQLKALTQRAGVEIGVITHEVGRLLRGELDADGLRVIARKMITLRGEWHDDIAKLPYASDDDLGELLKTIGRQCAIRESAAVRHPGPPADFETLRRSAGY
jgi:hypothetical protein